MPRLRMQDYYCALCMEKTGHCIELSDEMPSSIDSCPEQLPCGVCGEMANRTFSVPRLMIKGAVPDGTDRGDGWRVAREIAQVRSESFDKPWAARGAHHEQIRKLEEVSATKINHRNRQKPMKGNA